MIVSVAALLEPEGFGMFSLALVVVAVLEGVTDPGIVPAFVQSERVFSPQDHNALWTTLAVRGLGVSLIAAATVFLFTHSALAAGAIAVVPLSRGLMHFRMHEFKRAQLFGRLATFEASAAAITAMIVITITFLTGTVAGSLIGLATGEALRSMLSHAIADARVRPSFAWKALRGLRSFGAWVWLSGVATVVANQLDKFVTLEVAGVAALGMYQLAQRVAHGPITDAAAGLSAFLFPHLSSLRRLGQDWKRRAEFFIGATVSLAMVFAMAIALVGTPAMHLVLGAEWNAITTVFRIMAVAAPFGAANWLLASAMRADGRPASVFVVSLLQIAVFIVGAFSFREALSPLNALASAFVVSVAVSTLFLAIRSRLLWWNSPLIVSGAVLAAFLMALHFLLVGMPLLTYLLALSLVSLALGFVQGFLVYTSARKSDRKVASA